MGRKHSAVYIALLWFACCAIEDVSAQDKQPVPQYRYRQQTISFYSLDLLPLCHSVVKKHTLLTRLP